MQFPGNPDQVHIESGRYIWYELGRYQLFKNMESLLALEQNRNIRRFAVYSVISPIRETSFSTSKKRNVESYSDATSQIWEANRKCIMEITKSKVIKIKTREVQESKEIRWEDDTVLARLHFVEETENILRLTIYCWLNYQKHLTARFKIFVRFQRENCCYDFPSDNRSI